MVAGISGTNPAFSAQFFETGLSVQGSGFRVQGPGFRVQGSASRVQGSGSRVQGRGGMGFWHSRFDCAPGGPNYVQKGGKIFGEQFSVLSSQMSDVRCQFSVHSARFTVLSSQLSVLGLQWLAPAGIAKRWGVKGLTWGQVLSGEEKTEKICCRSN